MHALNLDPVGWGASIKKELDEIHSHETFRIIPDGVPTPRGHTRIHHHIVHDVKFDGRIKSRLVAGGHRSPRVDPEDCHASVVSMEAVRMGFLMAKLNNLQVCAGDIGNAHLNAKTNEKLCIIAGPEFGPGCAGKRLIVDKALCGTQNGGNQFHALTTEHFAKLDFHPSQAHPDLHIKKCSDGHCECIARHVDNVIVSSKDPMAIKQKLTNTFTTRGAWKAKVSSWWRHVGFG